MSSTYFDQSSSTYSHSCKTGIHGFFKSKEAKGILKVTEKYYPHSFEGKMLDVGCGPGYYSSALRPIYRSLHLTGVDPSQGMIEQYRQLGLRGVHSSLEDMADRSIEFFDIILCFGVLEFVDDIDRFTQSLKVLSRKESTLFIIAPKLNLISLSYFLHHKLRNKIHMRFVSRYIRSFESQGFKIVERRALTFISELLVFKIEKK